MLNGWNRILNLWNSKNREMKLLILVWLFVGINQGIYDTIFNNYLNDVYHISEQVRGFLEFPREAPGFLVAGLSAVLLFLPEVRLLGVAISLVAVGMIGQSFYNMTGTPDFNWMIYSMVTWSIGMHLFLPLSSSVTLRLSQPGQAGRSLGLVNSANTVSYIIGCLFIWLLMGWLKLGYSPVLRVAAFFGILAVICGFMMKPYGNGSMADFKSRFVFRKKYTLFYCLSILYGARKQVFLTFAPWVIVKVYHQKATILATLLIIASFAGIFFKPWLGRMIDKIGEKKILMGESVILVLVCMGYGYAEHLGLGRYGIYVVYLCYIIDQMLMAVTMARTTYLHKNLLDERDFTPSLSMGVSLDHAVSMTVPIFGGIMWAAFGFEAIFLAAAGIALINILVASRIRESTTVSYGVNLK
jgi:predicted MFS family arabinose efflux permease